jgi:two-component system, cell cycle sensor histidine kinase and response regulator CckA
MKKREIYTASNTNRLILVAAVIWSTVLAVSLAWNWRQIDDNMLFLAENEARSSFEKDMVYRLWSAMHGGVYVPPTEASPPNPYLAHVPDRDVTTTSGKELTLINPAYMTRQVHELGQEQYGLKGHITSLDPIRSENFPDPWETAALLSFKEGAKVAKGMETMDGQPYYRFMRPFVTEKSCLKCHGHQGYAVGDQQGGISVSVPMTPFLSVAGKQRSDLVLVHLLVGVLGLVGLGGGRRLLAESETRLRASEAQFKSLFHETSALLFIHDKETGEIVEANKAAWTAYGYTSLEELQAEDFWLDSPYSREDIVAWISKAATEGPQDFEWKSRKATGEIFWEQVRLNVANLGGVDRVLFTGVDITERKLAEEALAKQKQIMSQAEELAGLGSWEWDITNDTWLFSDNWKRIHGVPDIQLTTLQLLPIAHSEDKPVIEEFFAKTVNEGKPYDIEHRIVRQDTGEVRYIHAKGIPEFDDSGKTKALIGAAQDITARKQAEEEREKLQAQLNQAQKMESIGILAGGIAHDFNNLLHAMGGNLELLDRKIPDDHPGKKRIPTIRKSMDRAALLVKQMLMFSRKADVWTQVLDLNQEIHDAVKLLERSIPRMISIELILDENAWSINADPIQVEQVLLNLGTNAADAMADGGRLIIETANITLDQDFVRHHTGAKPGKYVLMTVTDTGTGMDQDTLEKIFDPFFTTKEVDKGTGLGLASAYGIVKAHEGYITCRSQPGRGTSFKIYWPAVNTKLDKDL